MVVGLGGVGSHCVNMLARSGVGKIRIIDFDQVTLSSLNRHAFATHADVGFSKAECIKNHLGKIVPWCEIDFREEMFEGEKAEELLGGNPDYVVDCIDNTTTKTELIAYCLKNNINIVSSMGTGGKVDFTRIRFASIWNTTEDELAKAIRK